ncbi:LytR/AlgR family response regulator transcription factor [Altibacter sp. HG106]|uniref:LytR/AlgR family response regulator transcription factor n=1 Tax=Altibacter sp. HG106 TaxID=3023937 RepID=UPI002350414B|nr:LytTR family DNA-binding domain-containing protein [Altibacter sp. HG106]MDC7995429.1 LytTR family DNA-binding domain-containing protein [Altibacter sp. HG106]
MDTYFIVENDQPTIERLQSFTQEGNTIASLGAAADYDTALNTILKKMPNLIFINMDSLLELPWQFKQDIDHYANYKPVFVGLSHSKELAFQAIKYDFFDVLLKPLNELELRKTFSRYAKKKQECQPQQKICLQSYKDFQYLDIDEIVFLKADNNCTDFHLKNGKVVSAYKTLKTYEEVLPDSFFRIHKSYIVNSKFISRIQYGKSLCSVKNGRSKIPFTKTFLENVELINSKLSQNAFQSLN